MVASETAAAGEREYRIGPGDQLSIYVHQVLELQVEERVNGRGTIVLPLVGEVSVDSKTVLEVEDQLAEILARDYLHNPQVSVSVAEYRANEIAVAGAVARPSIYSIDRPRSVLEMISLAGGVSSEAGYKVNVQTRSLGEGGQVEQVNLLVDLRELISSPHLNRQLILSGGDSVYVREAGYVYIEGRVRKPGAFKLEGEVTVLKALSLAGGTTFGADDDKIHIFRNTTDLEAAFVVDIDEIRGDPKTDILLEDGDIIVVGTDALKTGLAGLWRGITGVVRVGRGVF